MPLLYIHFLKKFQTDLCIYYILPLKPQYVFNDGDAIELFKKTLEDELAALADTKTAFSDGDAIEPFKKTLLSAGSGFVQVQETASAMKMHATPFFLVYDAPVLR